MFKRFFKWVKSWFVKPEIITPSADGVRLNKIGQAIALESEREIREATTSPQYQIQEIMREWTEVDIEVGLLKRKIACMERTKAEMFAEIAQIQENLLKRAGHLNTADAYTPHGTWNERNCSRTGPEYVVKDSGAFTEGATRIDDEVVVKASS